MKYITFTYYISNNEHVWQNSDNEVCLFTVKDLLKKKNAQSCSKRSTDGLF